MTRSNLKVLKRRTLYTVSETGIGEQKPQTIYIDAAGNSAFVIRLPQYIVDALGGVPEVRHALGELIGPLFEKKMREFQDWYRTGKAEPVILLKAELLSRDRTKSGSGRHDIDYEAFFRDSHDARDCEQIVCVALRYELAFRVNGNIHYRQRVSVGDDEYKVGTRYARCEGIVLDYTPALHARLDRICAALHDAAHTLHEIVKSKSPGAALLSMKLPRLAAPEAKR